MSSTCIWRRSLSPNATLPAVGCSNPATMRSVVLPQPDGPSSEKAIMPRGRHANRREEVARQFIDLIARFAPDFPDVLEHYEVLGPPDIEERIGRTAGNIFLDGFYLCGAATHPAGSVIALNGRNAAMAVLEDAKVLT